MTDYATRMRNAPDGPADLTTVEMTTWCIQARHGPGRPWITLWAGERHRSDDADTARKHETLAHQAYDRSYAGPLEGRLMRKVETTSVLVEVVPAMWETGVLS